MMRPALDEAVLLAAERWLYTRPSDYEADEAEMNLGLAVRAWIDNERAVS
jgi:hypothetical protein